MNKQRKTSNILNVFQYDEATGIIGLNGVPVSGYGLYLHTNINDGSVGIDSSASINAMYLLKNGTKQFEISYDTTNANPIFRLLPYQTGSFFEIGNPSNAGTDYVFIAEPTYGNVMIGPGLGNGTGNLTGATASIHKIQLHGKVFGDDTIQAAGFKVTGGSGFIKADGTTDNTTYLSSNQTITVSGDASGSGTTSINLTLANTAVTPGTYGSTTLVPVVTVDSKGRITNVTTAAISGALTFTGDVTGTGTTGTSTALTLANSGVTAGTYTKVTVDSKGRVTVGASATTSDIAEGTNLYYTDARVLAYLGANNYATQSYVGTQIANLVASAPAALDTLNELAAALGNDANFATTTATSLGNRLRVDIGTQGLTSTQQGYGRTNLGLGTAATSAIGDFATAAQGTKADSAYGWGNHASAGYLTISSAASTYQPLDADLTSIAGLLGTTGFLKKTAANTWALDTNTYLTSFTESDPIYTASSWYTTTNNATNWNTAYSLRISSATAPLSISSNVISISQASSTTSGYLSSTDWTTFNNKQNALTNPVTGTGTTNYLPKFTGTSTIGNSILQESSSNIGINQAPSSIFTLDIKATAGTYGFNIRESSGNNSVYITSNIGGYNRISSNYMVSSPYLPLALSARESNADLVLWTDGNTSIGQSSNAGYKLDVNGTGRFTSNLYTSTALYIATTAAYGFKINSEGNNGFYNRGGSTTAHYPFLLENSSGALLFQVQGSGAATFSSSVTAGGNITVSKSGDAQLIASTTDASGSGAYLNLSTPSYNWYIMNNVANTGDLRFRYNGSDKLTIATSGAATFSSSVTATGASIGRVVMDYDGTDSWFRMQSGNRMRITTTGGTDFIIPNTGNMTYNGNAVWHAGNLTNLNQLSNGPGYLTSVIAHNQAWSTITSTPTTLAGYGISNGLYSVASDFTTAGAGWYRVATTNSDGRGYYFVEVYCTGGNHNPAYLRIEAMGDWGNDKLIAAYTDLGFPASSVRITRGVSNTFLEVYFTTTILGASMRVTRLGFDSGITAYSGALPGGGDTVKETLNITSKINTASLSINGNTVLHAGNYGSYALPLSGGTMAGSIAMGGNNITNVGQIQHANGRVILYGNLHIDAFNGNAIYLQYYNQGVTTYVYGDINMMGYNTHNINVGTANGSFRAPIFYDSNDTTYYGDFAGTSNIYNLTINGKITQGYGTLLTGHNSSFQITINANYSGGQTNTYTPQYAGASSAGMFVMRQRNGGEGSVDIYLKASGTDGSTQALSTFNNTMSWHTNGRTSFGTASDWGYRVNIDGTGYATSDFRAPIFYDSQDTSYYVDPNSTSRLNTISSYTIYNSSLGSGYYFTAGSWGWRHQTPSGYIEFGPANGSYAHIYTNMGNFYFNVNDLYLNGNLVPAYGYNRGGDLYASRYYDANDAGYYGDFASISRMYGVAIRGDLNSTGSDNQIFFWGEGNSTTSAIGFKANSGAFGNPTGNGDGYNTYLTMDTVGRGWVFRRGVGGADFSSAYTAGWILNNGIAQFNASVRAPIFYDSEDTFYYLDPNGNSVLNTALFNLNASSTLRLISAGTNASMIRAGAGDELYIGGNDTWQMRFSGGNILMDNGGYLQNNESIRSPIFYDSNDTSYYLDPNGTSVLSTVKAVRYATYYDSQNPDSSHPGYGMRPFYSWNIGSPFNASGGYSNGITIGSHPGDQAYGFQIVQAMWDDRTYTRRYNSGWQSWRTLLTKEDDAYAYNMNQYVRTSDSPTFNTIYANTDVYLGANSSGQVRLSTYNTRNLQIIGTSGSDVGILATRNGTTGFGFQIYGEGSNYGFLNYAWGAWDMRKNINGNLYLNNQSTYYLSHDVLYTYRVYGTADMRSPIYYDLEDTSYYCDPNSVSKLHTTNSYYHRNMINVSGDHPYGIYFSNNNNSNDYDYAIYRQSGAWSHPYPDLHIAFHTGIKIGAYYGYNGTRFYNNSDWATITASVNDGDNNFRGYYDIIAYASDRRLKENIQVIDNAIDKVNKLTGMTYQWNKVGSQYGWDPDTETREVGVFAQEVQEVLPEAVKLAPFDNNMGVSKSGENFLTVKYEKIVPLLIEAIKEQQAQIEDLKKQINYIVENK